MLLLKNYIIIISYGYRNLKFIVEFCSIIFKNNTPDVFNVSSEVVTDALTGSPNKIKENKN